MSMTGKLRVWALAGLMALVAGQALGHSDELRDKIKPPDFSVVTEVTAQSMVRALQSAQWRAYSLDEPLPGLFETRRSWVDWRVRDQVPAAGNDQEKLNQLYKEIMQYGWEAMEYLFEAYPVVKVRVTEAGPDIGDPPVIQAMPDMPSPVFILWENGTAAPLQVHVMEAKTARAAFSGHGGSLPPGGLLLTTHTVEATGPGAGDFDITVRAGEKQAMLKWPVAVAPVATVELTITDGEDGGPVPARVSVSGAGGRSWTPLPPAGLRGSAKFAQHSWGGYMAEGQRWAYTDGTISLPVPAGEPVEVEVSRGPEYERPIVELTLEGGETRAVTVPLVRWSNVRERGYYPGDTHVHHLPPAFAYSEGSAEDLSIANVLVTEWGTWGQEDPDYDYTNVDEYFVGAKPHPVSTDKMVVHYGEEFRNHLFGHLIFLNIPEVVYPASTGKLPEHWPEGDNAPSNTSVSKEIIEQGGLVISPHFRTAAYEAPTQAVLGALDSADILSLGDPEWRRAPGEKNALEWYYGFLNCGLRIAATAGTDKMSRSIPIGHNRVYVKIKGKFTMDKWLDGIRECRTFVTNGPMLDFTVNGKEPGGEVKGKIGETVKVKLVAESRIPMSRVELIVNGEAVAEEASEEGAQRLGLSREIPVEGPMWIAARARGEKRWQHGFRNYPLWAHTSPVWVDAPGELPADSDVRHFIEVTQGLIDDIESQDFDSETARKSVLQDLNKAVAVYQGMLD